MENFTNDTIDTKQLPRFEEVIFSKLDTAYWRIIWMELVFVFVVLSIAAVIGILNDDELAANSSLICAVFPLLFLVILGFFRLGFTKKGFAFRQHDVLFLESAASQAAPIAGYYGRQACHGQSTSRLSH